ncbi:MAG: hypothetical protein JXR67_08765, partial [Bacteroidales bacterium]|nr:hypothetical protein [Bacteroidales bacterium]
CAEQKKSHYYDYYYFLTAHLIRNSVNADTKVEKKQINPLWCSAYKDLIKINRLLRKFRLGGGCIT